VDEQLLGFDPRGQVRVEPQHSVEAEDVGDEVVGESGEAVEVAELGELGAARSAAATWARLKKGTSRPS